MEPTIQKVGSSLEVEWGPGLDRGLAEMSGQA